VLFPPVDGRIEFDVLVLAAAVGLERGDSCRDRAGRTARRDAALVWTDGATLRRRGDHHLPEAVRGGLDASADAALGTTPTLAAEIAAATRNLAPTWGSFPVLGLLSGPQPGHEPRTVAVGKQGTAGCLRHRNGRSEAHCGVTTASEQVRALRKPARSEYGIEEIGGAALG
jgi:hypothetical protein